VSGRAVAMQAWFRSLRHAACALSKLGALTACGVGGGPRPDDDARVADSRVPLRYERRGLEGSGGLGLPVVGGEAHLQIPLSGNGQFGTDTDTGADDRPTPTAASRAMPTSAFWATPSRTTRHGSAGRPRPRTPSRPC